MARVRSITGVERIPIDRFDFVETPPGAVDHPRALATIDRAFAKAIVPGTVASSLRALGAYALGDAKDFDAFDYWFRCPIGAIAASRASRGERAVLTFEGLATLADAWLDDEHVLSSQSMWHAHEIDVTSAIRPETELFLRFSSLTQALGVKRPRPRYKTRLVRRQELRAFRTTLLGRMPGFSPPVAPVGPFRPISLSIGGPRVRASIAPRLVGGDAAIAARIRVDGRVERATLRSGSSGVDLSVLHRADETDLRGELQLDDVDPWWPHTHGAQPLYEVEAVLTIDGREVVVDLGEVGFRSIELDRGVDGRGFGLVVNGEPVFCRGAVFTPLDVVSLQSSRDELRAALEQVRRAGMNMLRLSGTFVYEADELFDLADELGLLVWQDFMFANMDYPRDEAFTAAAEREAVELLDRLETRASLAVLAGGSEVAQQAAMLGLGRDAWQSELFEGVLGRAAARARPDVPFVPSTPWGGALPFRTDVGVTHYYGVGAYERPLEDARRASVRFAAECLAFANVPSPRTVATLLAGGEAPQHHPRWKERVPRDHGAGWDFEDVRDHYVEALFGVDVAKVRYADPERYLALGRATTGEVMASVLAEWRRSASTCRGALVWLLRDLWPGAGFGLVEPDGTPKSCYFAVARALAPIALNAIDEGLNGLRFVAENERTSPLSADIEISMYLQSSLVKRASQALLVPARGEVVVDVEEVVGAFVDPSYAYRFGPPVSDVVVAKLSLPGERAPLATSFHFPLGHSNAIDPALGLSASGARHADGTLSVTVRTMHLATFVSVDVRGFRPDDDSFHLEPSGERTLHLVPSGASSGSTSTLTGTVQALNGASEARIAFERDGGA